MPYVDESDDTLVSNNITVRYDNPLGSASRTVAVVSGSRRAQYGFRSGPLSDEERKSLDAARGQTWATGVHNIGVDDAMEYNTRKMPFRVNDRRYSETSQNWGVITNSVTMKRNGVSGTWSSNGALVPTGVYNPIGYPVTPEDNDLRDLCTPLLRGTVPNRPELNLLRFVGEQRDAPKLMNAANYLPKSPSQGAGSALNYLFGVKPTLSDLQKMSETIHNSSRIISSYVEQEKRTMRRNTRRMLAEASESDSYTFTSLTNPGASSIVFSRLGLRVYAANHISASPGSKGFIGYNTMQANFTYTYKRWVQAFGTYQYFIPRPEGLSGRLDLYRRQAERLMGGGLQPSTVYDLTPYSWMANWFVDFGGLLKYQQAVAGNQVVASRQGYSYHAEMRTMCQLANPNPIYGVEDANNTLPSAMAFSCTPIVARKYTTVRGAGSPYSLSPTWPSSGGQQAIIALLGISKLPW